MKKTYMMMAAVILVVTATLAFAGSRGPGLGMGPIAGMPPFALSGLDLTEEQNRQIQDLQETRQLEIAPLQNELFNKRAELRLMWSEPGPDQEQFLAEQQEMFELQRKLQEKGTQYQLALRNILTPEQRDKLADFGPGAGRGPRGMMRGRW
jgi:Spy/CpxP family protein refolding chaperone